MREGRQRDGRGPRDGRLTSSNRQVAFTRTMVPGRSRQLSCSRKHTRSAALLEGAHTKIRLSGRAWYTCTGTGDAVSAGLVPAVSLAMGVGAGTRPPEEGIWALCTRALIRSPSDAVLQPPPFSPPPHTHLWPCL